MKKLDKSDKIALIIGSLGIWILVIIGIIFRIETQIGNYWVSIYAGLSTNILCYIILKIPYKKRD